MSKSRLLPWVIPVAALAGVGALWRSGPAATSADKAAPSQADAALAAGVDATHLIVDFRDDVSDAALAGNGYIEVPVSAYSAKDRLYRIDFPSADEAAAAKAKLAHDPNVESVDYDAVATLPPGEEGRDWAVAENSLEGECQAGAAPGSSFPNDACFKYQWHLRQIGMPDAWKRGDGKGVVVAVIDTGVTRVGDLADTKFVDGYNFLSNSSDARDDHGHGTHVAGTIAQSTNNGLGVAGVAYGASIMPLKVLSARGSGSVAGIAQAIRWAADHGASVINMSLGGPMSMGTMASAVKYAHEKGVVVVAAAGNDGRGKVGYPAAYPGVIAVASTQFDESTTFYSNWGKEVDIAAPGGNTRVDQNGDGKPDGVLQHTIVPGDIGRSDYLWFMGTSMASPHVAGVAALVVGSGVRKPDAVEKILLGTARAPKGHEAKGGRVDDHYGAGIIDAGAALSKAADARGAGELGLAGAAALFGLLMLRRRGAGIEKLGLGFAAALVAGSSGLFFLRDLVPGAWTHAHAVAAALSTGFPDGSNALLGLGGQGNPLIWSALAPIGLTALFYGVRRLRPLIAGFGFGVAGALLFAAVSNTIGVRYLPDALDPLWLVGNAAIAGLVATAVVRRTR